MLFSKNKTDFPFLDGEKLTFDIKYGIVTAGQATLSVELILPKENNSDTASLEITDPYSLQKRWRITSNARTNSFFDTVFRVRDTIESIATYDSLHSLRFTKRLHEGRYRQHRIHQNFPDLGMSIYSRYSYSNRQFTDERIEIPGQTYDVLSAFYRARMLNLQPGNTYELNVTSDGKNYVALINVLRIETINTIFGRTECLVIEPGLEGDALFKQTGEIHVWITNDEFKIPVLMQSRVIFGSFRAILSETRNIRR